MSGSTETHLGSALAVETATARSGVARIAVLGTGAVAQVVHLPILMRTVGVALKAVCDADTAKAGSVARRFGIPRVCASPDDLWQDPELDAVVVCTPSDLHGEHTRAALAAGKYVLCERPLGLTPEDVAATLEVPGADHRLMVAMNHRFRTDAIAIRDAVQAGELGEIFSVDAGWLNRRTPNADRSWRRRKRLAGGGALMDLGLPYLDLVLWMLGNPAPERVLALARRGPAAEVEDFASLTLRLVGERTVRIQVAWNAAVSEDRQYLDLLGTDGSASLVPLRVYGQHGRGGTVRSADPEPGAENPYTASYRREIERFIGQVRRGESCGVPQEQVTLMRITAAAYRSAERRCEVWLADRPTA